MIIAALRRKVAQFASDPTLRRWTLERALGRQPALLPFTQGRPPYLRHLPEHPAHSQLRLAGFSELTLDGDAGTVCLPLPGQTVEVGIADADGLIDRRFDDLEAELAVHRFAWVPLLGAAARPAIVDALWQAWLKRHRTPTEGWPWHPYTAAERAINLLRFGRRHGLPGPLDTTCSVLADHAGHIARRLEYQGDHNTSNHLANNGRGLLTIGLELGLPAYADLGAEILIEEAKRIFRPSGVLREASSHYHLLLTRSYVECWLLARRYRHAAAEPLEALTRRVLAVIPRLTLRGGFPLVGDVSPDCPPDHLSGLVSSLETAPGWATLLTEGERQDLAGLLQSVNAVDESRLIADGWLRMEQGAWSGLWHVEPEGWSPMPGHGHQDCGSFELHFEHDVVFRDLGRGRYGTVGEADVAATAHNGLTIDNADPYPANKPYYDSRFRTDVAGSAPLLHRDADGVTVRYDGYRRLGLGLGVVERRWQFGAAMVSLADTIGGRGRHRVARRLHTTLPVEVTADGVTLYGASASYQVSAGRPVRLAPATYWRAYGTGLPATAIEIAEDAVLPWRSELTVTVVNQR